MHIRKKVLICTSNGATLQKSPHWKQIESGGLNMLKYCLQGEAETSLKKKQLSVSVRRDGSPGDQ